MRPNLLYAVDDNANDAAARETVSQSLDVQMMRRCLALATESSAQRDYPFGAVVARNGEIIAEATNRVARDGDVTRHAEIVAMAEAQRRLGNTGLNGCTLYTNVEP
ncbi:MAG: nucleoside deaminase, partial [Pseudolabrys sp.]